MGSRSKSRLITSSALLVAALLPCAAVQAFEDSECSRIVRTTQHRSFGLRAGESIEIARVRAMDEVSKLAVAEVIGGSIDTSRSDLSDLNTEADIRHKRDASSLEGGETGEDRNGVKARFRDLAQSRYKGLVRVKMGDDLLEGPAGHQVLTVNAEVTVCQPKPENLLAADRLPPQIVDPEKAAWFNPITGEAQLWYWTGPANTYTFFDKAGFDPNTGDPLTRVDRQFQKDWRGLVAKRRKDALDSAERQQREAAAQQERVAAARQAAELRAAQDAQRIQGCNTAAANPNDPRKPAAVTGTAWDVLKTSAATAIPDCEAAVRLQPEEPRFRYQLARAYSVNDPKRALPLFKRLCDEHYPAAYDNYGWALLDRRIGRDDLASATRAFEAGVDAGDSDAMVSLASFMKRGSYDEAGPDDALSLYRRAAKLGNADAVAAVAQVEAEQAQAQAMKLQQAEQARQQLLQQQQAAQMFVGAMGGVLRNVGRH